MFDPVNWFYYLMILFGVALCAVIFIICSYFICPTFTCCREEVQNNDHDVLIV